MLIVTLHACALLFKAQMLLLKLIIDCNTQSCLLLKLTILYYMITLLLTLKITVLYDQAIVTIIMLLFKLKNDCNAQSCCSTSR